MVSIAHRAAVGEHHRQRWVLVPQPDGGPARYRVGNGDMTPIEWSVRAGSDGRFARYYLPFRANRDGGTVDVSVDAPDCAVSAAFEWRRGIRVID